MAPDWTRYAPTLRDWTPTWVLLWAACGLLIVGVDALLLEFTQHPFTAGMGAAYPLRTPLRIGVYAGGSWILDLVAILLSWLLALPLLRRAPLGPIQKWILAGCFGIAAPLAFSFIRYRVQLLLGPRLDIDLLLALSDGSPIEMWAQSKGLVTPLLFSAGVAIAAFIVAIGLLRRVGGGIRFDPPAPAAVVWLTLATTALALGTLGGVCGNTRGLCTALLNKPSGTLFSSAVRRATDFDGDGFGLLSRPVDPDPFNEDIYPWALEQPGNGRDENGLGGDLPVDYPVPSVPPEAPPRFAQRPHLLLIFLESFRADLLGRQWGGRDITPFINQLAREGGSSRQAHSSVPATIPSRNQLFGGRLTPYPGQSTMLHDFRDNGYYIAYFSGQDESFGAWAEEILALDVVDEFYDARQDLDRNYYFSNSSGSIAVTWKWLLSKVRGFLGSYDRQKPLFLYVNFHDTHYPYHHAEMDNILGVEPVPRHRIRPDAADALWATYANAAANVDRAIEELVRDFRRSIGGEDHAILITADHGESLFDNGTLGHGMRLSSVETRVPLVIWGLAGDWHEPIAIFELRERLAAALSSSRRDGIPRPRWRADPERRILSFLPNLQKPSLLALRGIEESLHYDFKADRWEARGPNDEVRPMARDRQAALAEELIHRWEAAALQHRAQREAARRARSGLAADPAPES